jgi:hypothetical protein
VPLAARGGIGLFPGGVAAMEAEHQMMREFATVYFTGEEFEFDGGDPDTFSCTTTGKEK